MLSLRERFEKFAQTLNGYENIDELMAKNDVQGRKRADYFINNRSVIIEQKSLEVDPINKPQNFINRLMDEGHFIAYGTVSTNHIFSQLPNGQDLQRQMILKITEVIEDNVEKADKQTRGTREIFSVPEAIGILVILNGKAEMLDPELVAFGLNTTFQKRKNGVLRYHQNDGVLYISEAHSIALAGFQRTFPIMSFLGLNEKTRERTSIVLDSLKRLWAQFNGIPFIEISEEHGDHLMKNTKTHRNK